MLLHLTNDRLQSKAMRDGCIVIEFVRKNVLARKEQEMIYIKKSCIIGREKNQSETQIMTQLLTINQSTPSHSICHYTH
jgi:hypothetical protein